MLDLNKVLDSLSPSFDGEESLVPSPRIFLNKMNGRINRRKHKVLDKETADWFLNENDYEVNSFNTYLGFLADEE